MNSLKREVGLFLIVGMTAVTTDLGSYYLLLGHLHPAVAKAISFVTGSAVAFIMNKFWTFAKYTHSYVEIAKFVLLYTVTLIANVTTNDFFLINFNSLHHALLFSVGIKREVDINPSLLVFLAFLVATAVSTILNFIGQKWWVFK